MTEPESTRCGVVAIIGAPNAGKSTLVNRLVGAKISIVTQKVQTTRARIRGVLVDGDAELVFIDTPGIFAAKGKGKERKLDRAMVAAAWDGVDGADAVLLVIDAPAWIAGENEKGASAKARADSERIIAGLQKADRKAILIVNKIDALPRDQLLKMVHGLDQTGIFTQVFLISAQNGDGVMDLKQHLIDAAPPGPWLYPEDQLSDVSDRFMAAEVTREKLFLRLHQELPYDATVETEMWKEKADGIRIEQTIYVARDSQKGIVLGKKGQTLKAIGAAARTEMTELYEKPVHLFLHVKVREGWANEAARLRQAGLDPVD